MSEEYKDVLRWMGEGRSEREKIWDGRGPGGGRGGSCAVNNGVFGIVMRSIRCVLSVRARGSVVISIGGVKGTFAGWNHMVHLVEFEGHRYLVDVGFGTNGPTTPVKLVDGNEMPWGVTGDMVRAVWRGLDEFETPGEKCWVLQHGKEGSGEWSDVYAFTEIEFLPQDIKVVNFKTTGDVRGSLFNHMIIYMKTVMEEETVGLLSLVDGKVKRKVKGKSEDVGKLESEIDRWVGLEKSFGIVLGEQERLEIRGLRTELQGNPRE